ncbi:uncharacterized protein F5891DRAFT_1059829 [Suillus fuscotomentosus]|uniref:Uncharacterized protein n=1 Tax=Suillus fuscotomentosus TaxID=1912939 RepID=A0AAD4DWE2_9AGAM|nr:uncharacterized protein F5891DRAFT_1059829 [Suillus fuscotomentosus]KAG1895237.1 hypothetical protein F5891DRAFT_1059829 [Suillus fuscotomentosus]
MSITDVAHRLILTVISLIVFMTSKILSHAVERQWRRDVSPGNAIGVKSLTICKETQYKASDIYELLHLSTFRQVNLIALIYTVSKSLRFFGKIIGVLGLVCSRHYVPWRTITIYEQPRYPPRVPGMRLIKYAPLFPRLASQLPWSSCHLENISSACKDTIRRREYVEVLAKSIIRRKVKDSQVRHGSISPPYHPVPSLNSQKAHDLRKALVKTLGASALKRESLVIKVKEAPHTPKEIRLERRMRLALGENLSIKNLASAAIARKAPASPLPDRSPSRTRSLQPKTRYRNQKSSRHSLHEAAPTSFTLFVNLGPDSEDAVPGSCHAVVSV